ncbi:alginate export family protein [Pedobacter miscanthi]|uniref:Alginate export domain-containing protein n=1 Tax=Pedobacter miscanthi TaxID=2259170 RepID=A0A366LDA9_9SPHI|nr:alginate export family protein [Pedobacter miscanthi]RBQ11861.1 hypothetical protein DRW42_00880 [Pedobacter miscanthi]
MNGIKCLIRLSAIAVLMVFIPKKMQAQRFMLLRFEEDHHHLSDSTRNFYNRLKYSQFSSNPALSLSFGGEIRAEWAVKVDESWIADEGFNHSFLNRYSLHAGVNYGKKYRFFVQLNSSLENGSRNAVSTTDEDKLNVQDLFLDYDFSSSPALQLLLKIGRQELDYGSGRLVSVKDGNNSRQYFTGLKLSYVKPRLKIDAFLLAADKTNPGIFDNKTRIQGNLWGVYSDVRWAETGNFNIYYLGAMREQSQFESGMGRELRHTLAIRYWKESNRFRYNLETAYQFGKFGQNEISAWTMAIEMGYVFKQFKFKPTLSLRNDYISGDKNVLDKKLNSFNPLYPKGGYFGFNPLIGPSNLIDIHPFLTLHASDKLLFQIDLVYNWRYSLHDGIFHPSGSFNIGGSSSLSRYIGTTYLWSADYQVNKYLSISFGYQYFRVGRFIRDVIPNTANSKFFNTQLSFKF